VAELSERPCSKDGPGGHGENWEPAEMGPEKSIGRTIIEGKHTRIKEVDHPERSLLGGLLYNGLGVRGLSLLEGTTGSTARIIIYRYPYSLRTQPLRAVRSSLGRIRDQNVDTALECTLPLLYCQWLLLLDALAVGTSHST
jgi:hypothetical protein